MKSIMRKRKTTSDRRRKDEGRQGKMRWDEKAEKIEETGRKGREKEEKQS